MNILCKYLKLEGTNYHFKWVQEVSGTAPYWKPWLNITRQFYTSYPSASNICDSSM
jgi:hypothetical protein